MVGLDTNIVLRYIMQDDERQSAIASRIFEKDISTAKKGFISSVVLCEAVWVLVRSYKLKRANVATAIRTLLQTGSLEIEHRECVEKAYDDFTSRPVGFTDSLLSRISRSYGAETTLTFDRDASQLEYFRLAQ